MTAEEDQRWVAAACAGDVSAFERLYRRHRDWVHRLAYRWTSSESDADDVVQEAFAYVLGKMPGLVLTGRLRTLLYPAVRHLARAAREKRGRFTSDDAALEAALTREGPEAAGSPGATRAELARVLGVLSEPQREVLLMRTVDGLSIEEVAVALDIPVGTVKSRLHHALGTLREDERTRRYFLGDESAQKPGDR